MANTINADNGVSSGSAGLKSSSDGTGILALQTNGTTAITVDASQNVGIGTASPNFVLDVSKIVNGNGHAKITNSSAGASALSAWTASNGTLTSQFGIVGTGYTTYGVLNANNAYVYNSGDISFGADNASGAIKFGTGSGIAERMRIDSSGNLLVGTTTSGGKLTVTQSSDAVTAQFNNNASSLTASIPGVQVYYGTAIPNNTGQSFLYMGDSSALRAQFRSNGGLANYSANNVNLSDRREKTNFAPAKSYLDVICAIPVQTFNYIDQNLEEDDGLTLGVIAQDVQAVAPELVSESNWGTEEEPKMRLSIYQTDLQYALMKCIQEQQSLITSLTARIEALEAK